MNQNSQPLRRKPKQARALHTHAVILEAAAQVLDQEGEAAFTTNRVAARAGVSIGTLYQYFPDKAAILVALSRQETERLRRKLVATEATDPVRRAVHDLIHAFQGRSALRRASVRAALLASLNRGETALLGGEVDHSASMLPPITGLTPLEHFVLSRAIMGAVRAAVLESRPELYEPAFEDALMTLVQSYRALARARSGPA
jgi:AcrR family transcriptional regulator